MNSKELNSTRSGPQRAHAFLRSAARGDRSTRHRRRLFLQPPTAVAAPDARIPERVGDAIELVFRHARVAEPPLKIPRLDRVVLRDQLERPLASHQTRAHVLARMVGRATVAELHELEVVVRSVLVHVVEVRHAPVGAIERLVRDFEPVALRHQLDVLVGLPIHEAAEEEATEVEIQDVLVRRIPVEGQVLRRQPLAPYEIGPLVPAREVLEPVAVRDLGEIVHRELTAWNPVYPCSP